MIAKNNQNQRKVHISIKKIVRKIKEHVYIKDSGRIKVSMDGQKILSENGQIQISLTIDGKVSSLDRITYHILVFVTRTTININFLTKIK